jgi:hypothetical protein
MDVHTQIYTYKNVVPHSYHPRLLPCMIIDPQSILSTYILVSFRDLKIKVNVLFFLPIVLYFYMHFILICTVLVLYWFVICVCVCVCVCVYVWVL